MGRHWTSAEDAVIRAESAKPDRLDRDWSAVGEDLGRTESACRNRAGVLRRYKRCSVAGCDRLMVAKDLCNRHWKRLRYTGTLDLMLRPYTPQEDAVIALELVSQPKYKRDWKAVSRRIGRTRVSCIDRAVKLQRMYPKLAALSD